MFKAGVGISLAKNGRAAGKEAAEKARGELGKQKPQIALIFSSVSFVQEEVLAGVKGVAPEATALGCSTAGEIVTQGPFKNSVAVMLIRSDSAHFHLGIGRNIKASALEAGKEFAKSIQKSAKAEKVKIKAVMMLPDGLVGNGADIVRGIQKIMGISTPLVGGSAGDDFKFKQTYQYYNASVESGCVVGAGISGRFTFGIGVRHGWKPIGIARKATKSDGARLYELDHKPAIEIYEDYFGKKADDLRKEPLARMAITYPLGMRIPKSDEYLIRDPITVEKDGSIICAAEIPKDSEIKLMIGGRDIAIQAAGEAAQMAVRQMKGKKFSLAIIFNCIAREKVLGRRAGDEIMAIRKKIGMKVPLIGFYTYGEQAPIGGGTVTEGKSCRAQFCNETVVIFCLA